MIVKEECVERIGKKEYSEANEVTLNECSQKRVSVKRIFLLMGEQCALYSYASSFQRHHSEMLLSRLVITTASGP